MARTRRVDPGSTEAIDLWLKDEWTDENSFVVSSLELNVVDSCADCSGNESMLHLLLKWSALKWLEVLEPLEDLEPKVEVKVYINYGIDPIYGRVNEVQCDVYGNGYNIEVGDTCLYNLITPLEEELTFRAVWVPFPRGSSRKRDLHARSYIGSKVTMYEIQRAT